MDERGQRLMWHGIALFLLGLFTGFLESQLANPRMGLAAHLEGVMNGTFLLALGAAWNRISLPFRLNRITFWGLLYGTYANWAATLFAAICGTGAMSPLLAAGRNGQPWQEFLVTAVFATLGIIIVVCCAVILWGLRQRHPSSVAGASALASHR